MRGYHDGQREAQRRGGGTAVAERLERGIRAELPDVARAFLGGLRLLFAGAQAPDGGVWCSLLAGEPGFVTAPDPHTVVAAAVPPAADPLARALAAGPAPVGLLAIEPQTRRRMRVNGSGALGPDGVSVHAEQVFSNCPKYIARRDAVARDAAEPASRRVEERTALAAADRRLVAAADTFVIGTSSPAGVDASHRGGSPGFVRVHDDRRLSFPDYAGNSMYMTLGNVLADPRAGLLFLDWETGVALQLSGRASVDWSGQRAADFPGAERVVDFEVERVRAIAGALPQRWRLQERSRFNPPAPRS